MSKKILLRNKVRCKKCGDVVESKTTYDHQSCKCGAVGVDGGLQYTRVLGDENDYETLYRWMTVSDEPPMSHMEFIRTLDHKPNRDRLEIVKSSLKKLGVFIYEQEYSTGTNLIVDLGRGDKRIGISSHFDRAEGSGGANDNGSAMAVCLDIISKFLGTNENDLALRIFFFDEEENGLKGSAAYVKEFGITDLIGLINMELVGIGHRFAVWPVPNETRGRLLDAFETTAARNQIPSNRFDQIVTNSGDHVSFRRAGLNDCFTVTCISSKDAEVAQSYYAAIYSGVVKEELVSILSAAPIFEHYHKRTDTFDKISEHSIKMTSDVIWSTLTR